LTQWRVAGRRRRTFHLLLISLHVVNDGVVEIVLVNVGALVVTRRQRRRRLVEVDGFVAANPGATSGSGLLARVIHAGNDTVVPILAALVAFRSLEIRRHQTVIRGAAVRTLRCGSNL